MIRRRRTARVRAVVRRGGASRRERGSVLVEAVLAFPLLAMLMLGCLEFGMAWRDSNTVSTALRSGGRTAATLGNTGGADYYTLQSLKAGLSGIPNNAIGRIVVYDANLSSNVPANCLTLPAPGGQTVSSPTTTNRSCNIYTVASFSLAPSSFSTSATGSCPGTAVDRHFCPLSRKVLQATGTDYLGVYVEVRHDFFSRMFGASLTFTDKLIVRLEPL
jgi:Flp pilus assembly protein TadG